MKKIAAKAVKLLALKKMPGVKTVPAAKAKAEPNTDALEKPHMVPGKPHNYRYK
jgi:hypothetical protein